MLPQPEDKIFNYQKFLQNPIWSQRHFNTSSADALLLCSPKTPPVILAATFFFWGGGRNHLMGLFLLAFTNSNWVQFSTVSETGKAKTTSSFEFQPFQTKIVLH